MTAHKEILKIGLAVTDGNRLLLVKRVGKPSYILPGGKPETGESDLETLEREIEEELGCSLKASTIQFLGSFTDVAADSVGHTVKIRLYAAELVGRPSARSEIEKLLWFCPGMQPVDDLAPSLRNQIVPALSALGRLPEARSLK